MKDIHKFEFSYVFWLLPNKIPIHIFGRKEIFACKRRWLYFDKCTYIMYTVSKIIFWKLNWLYFMYKSHSKYDIGISKYKKFSYFTFVLDHPVLLNKVTQKLIQSRSGWLFYVQIACHKIVSHFYADYCGIRISNLFSYIVFLFWVPLYNTQIRVNSTIDQKMSQFYSKSMSIFQISNECSFDLITLG